MLDFGLTPQDGPASTFARFRLSSDDAAADATGLADDGEVEDYSVQVIPLYDWGDAPDTGQGTSIGNYNTLANDAGPSHLIVSGIYMGGLVDDEDDGQPTAQANGDDTNPIGGADDEDGVDTSDLVLTGGQMTDVRVAVTNQSGEAASLFGWIDFDTNGVFELNERSSINVPDGSDGSIVSLNFGFAPSPDSVLQTYARFRLSTDSAAASIPVARASDGEVEDHPVTIAPEPSAIVLARFSAGYEADRVVVLWETTSEIDTSGFDILRSTTSSIDDAVPINAVQIVAQGFLGGLYELEDKSAVEGIDYYYWLIEVEENGTRNRYGPAVVTHQAAARPEQSRYTIFLPAINDASR